MEKKIERVLRAPKLPKLLRVAAYARVSTAKDAMHRSLSAQVSYYSDLIQCRPGWKYAGVYSDEAKTGTKDTREGFQRLLADCRAGKIDMVVTKSISRFARNTVTLLSTVRELKELGVDVFFEEQGIHSASSDGELMLTILASFAQAESESMSENVKWKVRKCFSEGRPWNVIVYGYRVHDGRFEVEPDEAAVVKRIFDEYLSGKGITAIAKGLTADGIKPFRAKKWNPAVIAKMLRNDCYTGSLTLQKTYRRDPISKKKLENHGELPRYFAEDAHEAIIDAEKFEAVQRERERRSMAYKHERQSSGYPYTGLIECVHCGKRYKRKSTAGGFVWICPTYNSYGKEACPSKRIPEETLNELTAEIDLSKVERMTADDDNTLRVLFADGSERTLVWKDRTRAVSWSAEMKEAARRKTLERNGKNG